MVNQERNSHKFKKIYYKANNTRYYCYCVYETFPQACENSLFQSPHLTIRFLNKWKGFGSRHATYVQRNTEADSLKSCRGKAISTTNSECVSVALVIQHAMRMRCIILPSVACPALKHFSTLSHKRHDFRKRRHSTKMCFAFL
jgi:hypothetical protein